MTQNTLVRVGVPLTGGRLVAAARERRYSVLFSANAFAKTYPKGHEREGCFRAFSQPNLAQYDGLDAALDSAGFVAAVKYGDYRWTVDDYLDLVASYDWSWWASMDYCVEKEIAEDRPLRLLRIAATARMLGECRAEADRRGLKPPMPVLQGWTPAEYVTCSEWLPIVEWPDLVGIGSVCRRQVHGPDGVLAILEAVDAVLPKHTKVHLFGVKSAVLDCLAGHPRVASVDSMAWDVQARVERRTGRDMDFRIGHMEAWANKQMDIAARSRSPVGVQTMLFDPTAFGGLTTDESQVLECLTLLYADLVMGGDLEYRDAVSGAMRDGVHATAVFRRFGMTDEGVDALNEVFGGLGELAQQTFKTA